MKLIKINLPTAFRKAEVFKTEDELHIIKSIDNTPKWGDLKHVSISREDKYPGWNEILEVKEKLFGDIDVMMVMPKKKDYVNVHRYCFHLWETPQEWGIR